MRAFDRSGRVAAVDTYLLCDERGQEATSASRIVDLETGDTLLDLAISRSTPRPSGRQAMTVSRVGRSWWSGDPSAVTLYDLATGDAVGTYLPDAESSSRAWRCRRTADVWRC